MTKIGRLTPGQINEALDEAGGKQLQDVKLRITSAKPRQQLIKDIKESVADAGVSARRVPNAKLKALVALELQRIQKALAKDGKVELKTVSKNFGSFAASLLEKLSATTVDPPKAKPKRQRAQPDRTAQRDEPAMRARATARDATAHKDTGRPMLDPFLTYYPGAGELPTFPAADTLQGFTVAQARALHRLYWGAEPYLDFKDFMGQARKLPEMKSHDGKIETWHIQHLFAELPESFPFRWQTRNANYGSWLVADAMLRAPRGTSLAAVLDAVRDRFSAFPFDSAIINLAKGPWCKEAKRFPFLKNLEKKKDGSFLLEGQGEVDIFAKDGYGRLELSRELAVAVRKMTEQPEFRYFWSPHEFADWVSRQIGGGFKVATLDNLRRDYGDELSRWNTLTAAARTKLAHEIRRLKDSGCSTYSEVAAALNEKYGDGAYAEGNVEYVQRKHPKIIGSFIEARFDETKKEARQLLAALENKLEGETDIQIAARLGHKEMRAKRLIQVIHQEWPGELGGLEKEYVNFTKEDDQQLAEALERSLIGGTPAQLYELLEKDYPQYIERHATKVPKRIAKSVRIRLGVESWRVYQQTRLAELMARVSADHPGASMRELYEAANEVQAIAFPIASLRNGPARWKADPEGYPEIAALLDGDGMFPWEREVGAAAKPSGTGVDPASPASSWAAYYKESSTLPSVAAGETVDTFDDAQVKALHALYWGVPPATSLTEVVKMAVELPEFQGRSKPVKDRQLGRLFAKMPESFPWEWRSRNLALTSSVFVAALLAEPKGTSVAKVVDRLQMSYPGFPGTSTFNQAAGGRGSWAAEPERFPFADKLQKRQDGTYVLEARGELRGVEKTIHGKLKLNADLAHTVKKLALSDEVRFDWELEDLNTYLRGKLGDGWSDSTFRNLRDRHGKILPDFHAIRHEAKRRLCELMRDLHGEPRNIDNAAEMSKVLHEEFGFPEYDQVRYAEFRNDFDFVPKFREARSDAIRDDARALLDAILADPDTGRWETAKALGHEREQAKYLLKVIHDTWPEALPGMDVPRVAYTAADKKAMQQAIDDGPYGAGVEDVWDIMKTEHPEFFERHPLSGPLVLYQVIRRELGIDSWQAHQRLRTEKMIAKALDSPQKGMTLVDLHEFLQNEYDVRLSYSTLIKWQREWKKKPAEFPHITALSTRHKNPDTGSIERLYPWDFAKIPYTEALARQVTAVIDANEGKSLPEIIKLFRADPELKARYPTFDTHHIHQLRNKFDFVPLIDDLKVREADARQKAHWRELDKIAVQVRKVADTIDNKSGLTASHVARLLSKKGTKVAEHRVRKAILRHLDLFPWYRGNRAGSVDLTMASRVAMEMERAPLDTTLTDIIDSLMADDAFAEAYPAFNYQSIQTLRDAYPDTVPLWQFRNQIMRSKMIVDELVAAKKGTKLTTILKRLEKQNSGSFGDVTAGSLKRLWDTNPERYPFVEALRDTKGKLRLEGMGTPDAVDETPPVEAAHRYAKLSEIPGEYPVLDSMTEGLGKETFADYEFVCVQHMLGGQVPFFETCRKLGMARSRTSMIGIPYSTSQTVVDALRDKGWDVRDPPLDIAQWLEDVRTSLYDRVRSALKHGRKIRVLDDGGMVAKLLATDPYLRDHADLFALVEQTRRGITVADEYGLACGLVNAAQSLAKVLEGLLIGNNLQVKLIKRLEKMGIKSVKGMKIGICAHGAISAPLAAALRDLGALITVRDVDPEAQQAAIDAGFKDGSDAKKFFGGQDMILGASGVESISAEDLEVLKDGTILGSCSSKLVEIDVATLARLAAQQGGSIERLDDGNFPPTVQYNLPDGRSIRLLASGFPLNFDGDVNNLDPWRVQLTHAIMLGGLLQSTGVTVAGVHRLDPSRQLQFLDDYVKLLGDEDEDREIKKSLKLTQLRLEEAQREAGANYARRDGKMRRLRR